VASESFAADWLALREPADHRARADALLAPLVEWRRARGHASTPLRVVDLGSGTGSNLRYLAPRLPGPQEWTLVDQDAALLARALELGVERVAGVGRVERVRGELAHEGLAAVRRTDLVTASALLDLVSQAWLDRLVKACAAARCAALFALSWDGVIEWDTPDPDDALVADAVRAHQRRDKGMGPALGPAAGPAAERAFKAAGFRTEMAASAWVLGRADRALVRPLIAGWADAAAEQRPSDEERVRAWEERRRTGLERPFRLTVGHLDALALPPA
jgi:SAM-dependent methyltransferase